MGAYTRKDSAQTHQFRVIAAGNRSSYAMNGSSGGWPRVSKVVPVAEDGSLATGVAKTMGDLLGEQANALMENPDHLVDVDVSPSAETVDHIAGQLSQLLIHILTGSSAMVVDVADIIVAP